jgi:myo-inositol-1(or 4)-monophosphatase
MRVFGSNCLDLANTASGRIDGYISDKIDDSKLSAGLLILRESGGIKVNLNGSKYSVMTNNLLAESFTG